MSENFTDSPGSTSILSFPGAIAYLHKAVKNFQSVTLAVLCSLKRREYLHSGGSLSFPAATA